MQLNLPSKYLQDCVDELSKLPGVGRKSALRIAMHILNQHEGFAESLGNSIVELKKKTKRCSVCQNISDTETCSICSDKRRDKSLLCVVENVQDVLAIEATQQFNGLYHVLGGVIAPLDGIGPEHLTIKELMDRVNSGSFKELIFALSATMEGDTTNFYLYKLLHDKVGKTSSIARGVSIGNELEYTDELSLGKSITQRIDFEQTLKI